MAVWFIIQGIRRSSKKLDPATFFSTNVSTAVHELSTVLLHADLTTIDSSKFTDDQHVFFGASPGRTESSNLEAPDPLITVALLQPAFISRPGPVFEDGEGVFQLARIGKYFTNSNISPLDIPARFSHLPTNQPIIDVNSGLCPVTNLTGQCEITRHLMPASASPPRRALPLGDVSEQQTASTVLISSNSATRVGRQQCDSPCNTDLPSLLCYYQNVHGLRSKVTEFALEVSNSFYDCIILTESWLDAQISSTQLFGIDYTVYRTDRSLLNSTKARGGGVIIAVRRSLASALLIEAMDESLEQLWVTVKNGAFNIVIGAIYIPPNMRNEVEIVDRHILSVEKVINSTSINDDLLIFGDYNRAGLSWSMQSEASYLFVDASRSSVNTGSTRLLDGMAFHSMYKINSVCNLNGRFLDLIFANSHALPACSVTTAPDPLCNIDVHHLPLMVTR